MFYDKPYANRYSTREMSYETYIKYGFIITRGKGSTIQSAQNDAQFMSY